MKVPKETRVPARSQNWPAAGVCMALLLAVLAVFGQTANFQFVDFDDQIYVYENPRVTCALSLSNLAWTMIHPQCSLYHPLTMISLMVDHRLYGLNAGGYHLTNVLIHAASAVLLFLVLWQMTRALWRCAFVAAVFAIHPLRAESVAWVSERKDVLAAFFLMLTVGAYFRYGRKPDSVGRYLLVAGCFTLGLLCKPTLVTLPLALLLLDYWPLGRFAAGKSNEAADQRKSGPRLFGIPRRLLVEKIPLGALAAAVCVVTIFSARREMPALATVPLPQRLVDGVISCVIYLRQMVWPAGLTAFYPFPAGGWPLWKAGLALLVLTLISAGAVALRRRQPWLLAGWFWSLAMLLPVLGVVQVGNFAHADRFTYLSGIGLAVAVVWAVGDWTAGWKGQSLVLGCLMLGSVAGLGACAYFQTASWRDGESLWTRALAVTVNNSVAHNGLGFALARKGEYQAAAAQFHAALQIEPDFAQAHNNLGVVLQETGKQDEATVEFRTALAIRPDYLDALSNLGANLEAKGSNAEAVIECRKALEIDPTLAKARFCLGRALAGLGQLDEAIAQFRQTISLTPDDARLHFNLGNALSGKGQLPAAAGEYRQAVQINPNDEDCRFNLGLALFQIGETAGAITQYRAALKIKRDDDVVYNSMASALAKLGKMDEAAASGRQAVKINPRSADNFDNLGVILAQQGNVKEAITNWEQALALQPDRLGTLNNLAWPLATAADASLRDGRKAVALAEKARELSAGNNAIVLHTLAAAYAETGRFSDAVSTTRRALELAMAQKNDRLAARLEKEIKLYEAGTPIRDTPP